MRSPRAFSLVELLTALVLLAVGLASYARAAAAVARLESTARMRRTAAAMLVARLDSLTGLRCGESRTGESTRDGVREFWQVSPAAGRLLLSETIETTSHRVPPRHYTLPLECRP
jgi:prepilin-type N-terminal cleavage/methylation domain-containing protein